MTSEPAPPAPSADPHLIHVEEQEIALEHHPEDWIALVLFWGMAVVVFLQFFSRYILNDAITWTEEIARYMLMALTFVGAATAMRRGTHIAVEVLHVFLPEPIVRAMRLFIDVVTIGFLGLLVWFAWQVMGRMEIQRMVVFDVSMSWVYGGVLLGCGLMLLRAVFMVWGNARRGWRADPSRATLIVD
jgi:TRAP-type C4-dicarboxylate transport system permease small subunit